MDHLRDNQGNSHPLISITINQSDDNPLKKALTGEGIKRPEMPRELALKILMAKLQEIKEVFRKGTAISHIGG